MLIHPSSGACDLFDELKHELYYSGSMCVGVPLRWCGIRMEAEALLSACIWIPHHHTVTPTHIEPEQYNHALTHQIKRKLLRMDVLISETC